MPYKGSGRVYRCGTTLIPRPQPSALERAAHHQPLPSAVCTLARVAHAPTCAHLEQTKKFLALPLMVKKDMTTPMITHVHATTTTGTPKCTAAPSVRQGTARSLRKVLSQLPAACGHNAVGTLVVGVNAPKSARTPTRRRTVRLGEGRLGLVWTAPDLFFSS